MATVMVSMRRIRRDPARPVEGELILERRLGLGLSQRAVGAMVGFSGPWISHLENPREGGGPRPDVATYARVAMALGMTEQDWMRAAGALPVTSHERSRLIAIAAQVRFRAAIHGPEVGDEPMDLTVEQVIPLLGMVAGMCSDEVMREALKHHGFIPPDPPSHMAKRQAAS